MIAKKVFLLFLLTAILVFPHIAKAAPAKNPIFATIAQVEQMITDALAPLNNAINGLTARIAQTEEKVSDLEDFKIETELLMLQLVSTNATMTAKIEELEQRISDLENPPDPQPSILLQDNFDGPSLDMNIWEFFSTDGGNYSFDNGFIVVPGGSSMFYIRTKNNPFPSSDSFTVEFGIQFTSAAPSGVGVALGIEQQNGYDQSNIPVSFWQDSASGLVVSRFGLKVADLAGGIDLNYHVGKIIYDGDKYLVYNDGVLKYTSPSSATAKTIWFGNPFCCSSTWTGFKLDYIKITNE